MFQAVEAKKKCPNLMAVHVATYKEGDSEPRYWDDPSPLTHKVRPKSKAALRLTSDSIDIGLIGSLSSRKRPNISALSRHGTGRRRNR
jgi:CRISPR/Cas system CMR subunit Cmr6 (Cas7 group RAMP superfamily)